MRNNLLYKTTGSGCADIDSTTLESCILRVVDCDKTDGTLLLTDCDETYMCNRCQTDPVYYMPWVPGMTFMLQTQFVNTVDTEPETPSAGFGSYVTAELLDFQFNVVESDFTQISSRYLAGWNGDNSYQVIEIDTSLPAFDGLNCFIIRINARDSFGTVYKSLCTHHFEKLRPCDTAIRIEGLYANFDCFRNYYALPDVGSSVGSARFKYSNGLYFRANVKDHDDSFEKTIISNRVVSVEQISSYRLVFHNLLPAYAMRILTRQLLPAARTFADGEEYSIPTFTMNNLANNVNYYFFTVDMQRTCDNNFRCVPVGEYTEPPILPPVLDGCVDCIDEPCVGST